MERTGAKMIVSLINLNCGVCKTTSCIALATAAARDGKEVVVYTEPENVLHDEDVEDFSAEEIAALLADAD